MQIRFVSYWQLSVVCFQVVIMLLVILFVFTVCWLPVQISILYLEYRSSISATVMIQYCLRHSTITVMPTSVYRKFIFNRFFVALRSSKCNYQPCSNAINNGALEMQE